MNRIFRIILGLMALGLFIGTNACKAPRQSIKAPIKEEGAAYIFKNLKESEFTFHDLSARFSASFSEEKGRKTTLSGQIRMMHDSIIWVSVSPLLGIEVFRIIFSQDSVFLLNRLEKSYFRESFSFVNQYINSSLDFDMLQAFLLGNDFAWYENGHFKAGLDGSSYKLSTTKRRKLKRVAGTIPTEPTIPIQDIWLSPETFKISKVMIMEAESGGRKVQADYDQFVEIDGQIMPMKVSINTDGDKKLSLEIEYSKVSINTGVDFPFKVPGGYSLLP